MFLSSPYQQKIIKNYGRVNTLLVLIYLNQDSSVKRFNGKKYYLPKGIIGNYQVIVNRKNFCDQPIDSDIKQKNKKTDNRTR